MGPKWTSCSMEAPWWPHTAVLLSPAAPVCCQVLHDGQCHKHRLSPSGHTPYGRLLPFTWSCRFPAAYVQPSTAGSSSRWFDLHVIRRKDWSLQIFNALHDSRPTVIFTGWFACFIVAVFILLWEDTCAFCRSKRLLSLQHLTVMDLSPSLTSLGETSSSLLLSIKRMGWAGILPCLTSVSWYKLSEVFYSTCHQSIKALK